MGEASLQAFECIDHCLILKLHIFDLWIPDIAIPKYVPRLKSFYLLNK